MKLADFILPVINTENNCIEAVCLNDIERFEKDGRYTIASIGDMSYRLQFYDLEIIEEMFMCEGLWLTDRSNVVNLNKVVQYDIKLGNLYFKNSNRPASVAKIHQKEVEKELIQLGILVPRNQEKAANNSTKLIFT